MGKPAFMIGNAFSKNLYPDHALTMTTGAGVTDDPSGTESYRLATGRRQPYTNKTAPTNTNTQILIPLTCGRLRSFNGLVIDRAHNLAGKEVKLEVSSDNFATPAQTAFDIVLPSICMPGALDDAYGVRTEEGAWVKRYPRRAGKQWRLNIPAMGSGVRPQIIGATLGNWISQLDYLSLPSNVDGGQTVYQEFESDAGWKGRTAPTPRRDGPLQVELRDLSVYEQIRADFQVFAQGYPMWLVHDDSRAQQALCVLSGNGRVDFILDESTGYHTARIETVEHAPLRP